MGSAGKYTVPAVIRVARMLELIADTKRDRVTFADICKELEMPKSTVYGLINTLLECGYLREAPNGGYRLGIKLFSLGNKALAGFDIREEAKPFMEELVREVGQTSFLGIMEGGEGCYIAKVLNPMDPIMLRSSVGTRFNLQTTGIGKALLAWRDEQSVRGIIAGRKPTMYTRRAVLDPDQLILQLEKARRHGFVLTDRETHDDCICVAAPVFSMEPVPIAGVSIATLFERMNPDLFALATRRVHAAAKLLSEQLGASGYPEFIPMPYPVAR